MTDKVPELAPFCGWRFAPKNAQAEIAQLVCPPYDVIDAALQKRLAERSVYNAVHLILPEVESLSAVKKGGYAYEPQKQLWEEWRRRQIIVRDAHPALYVCEQVFKHPFDPTQSHKRLGVIALKRLEELGTGKIKAHENTLSGPKEDRLNLMRALRSNMSPIFGLFPDASAQVQSLLRGFISQAEPVYDFKMTDPEAAHHRLWLLTDAVLIKEVCKYLSGSIYIADGHHRYETALKFAGEMARESAFGANAAPNYIPIFLASLHDPGLLVLPTHRLVFGLSAFEPRALLDKLSQQLSVECVQRSQLDARSLQDILGNDEIRFVLKFGQRYAASKDDIHLLKVPEATKRTQNPLQSLGVTYLQEEILAPHLGINAQLLAAEKHLHYTRDPQEALAALEKDEAQAAFFTQAPSAPQVSEVCEAGLRMPQKSTFFYPKVLTGLVFRVIDPTELVTLPR